MEVYPEVPKECDIYALVDRGYKIITVSLGDQSAVLLYHLENDPLELNNIADEFPALTDSLLIEMEMWDEMVKRHSPLDPERLKYFRSLGYINQ